LTIAKESKLKNQLYKAAWLNQLKLEGSGNQFRRFLAIWIIGNRENVEG